MLAAAAVEHIIPGLLVQEVQVAVAMRGNGWRE
jgi:hypothetical protein